MAEFTEVLRQQMRMCEAHVACNACPVRWTVNPGQRVCYDFVFENPAIFEERVMKWAAEHPEPVYPTWEEWQNDNFPDATQYIYPCLFDAACKFVCEETSCVDCRKLPIRADIAEKLGVKPIENKGGTGK